jgi:hypothetical protein
MTKTELQVFEIFMKKYIEVVRDRMKISQHAGRRPYWTAANRFRLLNRYKELIVEVRKAKKLYGLYKHLSNCKELIKKSLSSNFPDAILNKLYLQGKSGEPTRLLLSFLSPEFENASVRRMEKILSEER